MTARWVIVLLTAATLVLAPLAVSHRPVPATGVAAADLAHRVQGSAGVGWSGLVESSGALPVPDSEGFAALGDLLGADQRLRVWWRGPQDWRVDRIRGTGEADLVRQGGYTTRWVFESETATLSPVSTIRLPDASDLLPPTLGRSVLQGVRDAEVTALPSVRVAGVVAAGLRLRPDDPAATVDHVDLWADPVSGLAVRVELYAAGERRPVLRSTLSALDLATPAPEATTFLVPDGVALAYEESTDVAAAANALAVAELPARLAGLPARGGRPGAVGVYGRGPTRMIVLPLRGRVAGPLRERLRASSAVEETGQGTFAPAGPVGLLLTPRTEVGSYLLAGTVTAATLELAARQLSGTG